MEGKRVWEYGNAVAGQRYLLDAVVVLNGGQTCRMDKVQAGGTMEVIGECTFFKVMFRV